MLQGDRNVPKLPDIINTKKQALGSAKVAMNKKKKKKKTRWNKNDHSVKVPIKHHNVIRNRNVPKLSGVHGTEKQAFRCRKGRHEPKITTLNLKRPQC